jgi:hypothetical protein
MSGNETPTEEELADMRVRQAWEDAHKTVAQRVAPPVTPNEVDVNSLPDAPPPPPAAPAPAGPPPEQEPGFLAKQADVHKRFAAGAARQFGLDSVADKIDPPPAVQAEAVGKSNAQIEGEDTAQAQAEQAAANDPNNGRGERHTPDEGQPSDASGASSGGGGAVASGGTPGGMGPYTEKRETKYGKVVAPGVRAAQGEAASLRMDAAGIQRDAEGALIQREGDAARARMLADQQAAADQQRLAEDRERIVGARLAQIESLNKQAAGNPDDLWNSSHVFGRLTGFLMLTLGTISMATGGKSGVAPGIALSMGGKFINGLVNEDIASQSANRTAAAKLAGRQTNLLHLHEENLKDKSKAIEATKLAYYDSILHQMDAYKADHAGEVNEANYRNLQASILEEKAKVANGLGIQEQSDVTDELVNKYRPPTSGGGGAAAPQPGFIVRTPDGTTYSMPNEQQQNKAIDSMNEKQRLIAINNDITKLREATKKLPVSELTQRQVNIARLQELEQQKLKGIESAEKQGVLREGEYERARALTGYATHGLETPSVALRGVPVLGQPGDARLAAGDAVIAAQTERWNRDLNEIPANASASVVHAGYAKNPQTGQLEKRAEYTGQDRKPTPGVAPQGTESREPGRHVPTAGPSGEEKTPPAPRFPYLPPPAAHHKKKKAGT